MGETTGHPAPQRGADAVERTHQGIEQAEAGKLESVEQIDEAEKSDPAGARAAEQEAADGPPGRGLSR